MPCGKKDKAQSIRQSFSIDQTIFNIANAGHIFHVKTHGVRCLRLSISPSPSLSRSLCLPTCSPSFLSSLTLPKQQAKRGDTAACRQLQLQQKHTKKKNRKFFFSHRTCRRRFLLLLCHFPPCK